MPDLPTGTVTFLFTDVEGSTKLWESRPDEMGAALTRHDDLIETVVERASGSVVRPRGEGDSRFCVFARATDAVAAALDIQRALAEMDGLRLRVRMALHTGEADLRAGDYYGPAVNRCARLRSLAHGGQTLVSLATEEMVRDGLPDDAWLQDLGAHQLKDLTRIEHVFQLCHPGLGDDFAELRSLERMPHNLPVQLTSFVGRDDEVRDIRKFLAEHRLVTLTGAAGCGKTRLAVQTAGELIESFIDGVWFVDLAPLADPSLVPQAIATTLSLQQEAGRALMDSILDSLRLRTLLLIFDNCEHVLSDASDAAVGILRACPGVRILATGRESLGVAGEMPWRVPSLTMPDDVAEPTLEMLAAFESARLFLYRARGAAPSAQFTDDDAPAIAQICRRLDGIPLALELAAARTDVLSCDQIADRLGDQFRLLTGGSRTALERQQTLRAAVDWSYGLLSGVEKVLLARMSVFTGGCTLEACEQVCAGGDIEGADVLDLVSQLARKSLVTTERAGRLTRYRLLETMRQYAREKLLEVDPGSAVRDRHLAWCRQLARDADAQIHGPQRAVWLDTIGAEHDNMRGALEWAIGSADAEAAITLAVDLSSFWTTRGLWTEARRWISDALALPGGSTRARARALAGAGQLARRQSDLDEALALYESALSLGDEIGYRALVAKTLFAIGTVASLRGDDTRVKEAWDTSLAIAEEIGDLPLIAAVWNGRGVAANTVTDSRERFERALTIARQAGDVQMIGLVLGNLGAVAVDAGEYAEASRLLGEALENLRPIGAKRLIGVFTGNRAVAAFLQVDYPTALTLCDEFAAIGRELGGVTGEHWQLKARRFRSTMAGDFEDVVAALMEDLALAESVGDRHWVSRGLLRRGEVLSMMLGRLPEARADLERCIEVSADTDSRDTNASARTHLGIVEQMEGHLGRARALQDEGLRAIHALGFPMQTIMALERIAWLATAEGDAGRGARLFAAAEAARERLGVPVWPMHRPWYVDSVAATRRACDPDDLAARAWEAGRAMPLDDAIAHALGPSEAQT